MTPTAFINALPLRLRSTKACHAQLSARPRFSASRRVTPSAAATSEQSTTEKQRTLPSFSFTEQWYALACEVDIQDDIPYAFTVFETELVLFRTAPGKYTVLDDRCSHRLAPLSEGRITQSKEGDTVIECAYHGWSFRECGTCACIPQNPPGAAIPRRAAVRNYPTTVGGGLIWVWLGDAENADVSLLPIPKTMFDGSPALFKRPWARYLEYGLEALIENIIDPVHLFWAHHKTNPGFDRKFGGSGNRVELKTASDTGIVGTWRGVMPMEYIAPASVLYRTSFFTITPISRDQSRLFIVQLTNDPKQLVTTPYWRVHAELCRTTDGDSILLRHIERRLGTQVDWRKQYVPVESDGLVIALRKWFDERRDALPWKTDGFARDFGDKRKINDRYETHTKHCVDSMAALRKARLGKKVIEVLLNVFGTLFVVGAAQMALAGSSAILTNVLVGTLCLGVLLAILLRLRHRCNYVIEQLTYSDDARERMLQD